ncbi:MAG: TRAP transporter substrate-binding protein [Pseudomonadota bacterium]
MSGRSHVSFSAALALVATAFIVGVVASLAIRPAGAPPAGSGESAATAPVGQALSWRVHSAFNTRLPVLGEGMRYTVDRLREITGGRMDLELFEPGELAPALAGTESVRSGKVEAAFTWLGYDQGRIPASTLLGAVPFGMEPPEYAAWWFFGGGRELAESLYADHGAMPLLCGLSGPETAGWFREPIETVEDLQGLKIRFSGLAGKVLQRLGASVTVLPGGEIFQALEKGAIDASEFSLPVIDNMLGFDRVVKLNYFPGWHQTFSAFHLLVNLELWQTLAPTTQAQLESVCVDSALWSFANAEASQGSVLAAFPDKGVEAATIPTPLLRVLRDTTRQVMDEEAAADEWFARVLESQRAFNATYRLWERKAYVPRDFDD